MRRQARFGHMMRTESVDMQPSLWGASAQTLRLSIRAAVSCGFRVGLGCFDMSIGRTTLAGSTKLPVQGNPPRAHGVQVRKGL